MNILLLTIESLFQNQNKQKWLMSKLSCFDRQTAGRSERPLRASYDATARPRCLRLLRAGGGSENGQGERPPDDLPSLKLLAHAHPAKLACAPVRGPTSAIAWWDFGAPGPALVCHPRALEPLQDAGLAGHVCLPDPSWGAGLGHRWHWSSLLCTDERPCPRAALAGTDGRSPPIPVFLPS